MKTLIGSLIVIGLVIFCLSKYVFTGKEEAPKADSTVTTATVIDSIKPITVPVDTTKKDTLKK